MKNYLITFRSVTYGQKGERVLKRGGINCYLRRTPKILTPKECSYALQVRHENLSQALELLQREQVQFGKVYAMDGVGNFEELPV